MSTEEVASNTQFLESRFATSSTFKGTRSHHQFIPDNTTMSLTMKKTSFADHSKQISVIDQGVIDQGELNCKVRIEDIKPGRFYVCQYDKDWYFCVANDVSNEHGDVNVKFLHPKGPSEKFYWPQRDDVCWVPIEDVYCEVDTPSTRSTGRFYCFDKITMEKAESYFD